MQRRNELFDIILGVLLLFALHIVFLVILGILTNILSSFISILPQILFFSVFGIGLSQLFYVIPLVLWLEHKHEWGKMKGIIIGAVITALLNGGCYWLISSGG